MDRIVHRTVTLPCMPRRAFELFTRDDLLCRWLCIEADVEAKEGGRYELFWDPADHTVDSTVGCRITALQRDQFLAFEWKSSRQFAALANAADPLTHVVVFFLPLPAGTTVHLVHSGWRGTTDWEEARRWQEHAWQVAFDALEQIARDDGGGPERRSSRPSS